MKQQLGITDSAQHPIAAATRLRLRSLLAAQLGLWSLSFVVGLCTLLATVLLLASSGWFISAAAAAGVGALFNYMRPGALIRLFAIVRTAGRYGERLLSHALVLRLLAMLRVAVFVRLSQSQDLQQQLSASSGDRLQRLIGDIDLLDQLPLRLMNPLGVALLLGALYLLALSWLLPAAWPVLAGILLVYAATVLLVSRGAWHDATAEVQLQGQRRSALLENLQVLTTLLASGHWQTRAARQLGFDQQLHQLQQRQQVRQLCLQASLHLLMLAGLAVLFQALVAMPLPAGTVASDPVSGLPALTNISVPVWLALVLGWLGCTEVLLPLALLPASYGQVRAAQQRCNELWRGPATDTAAVAGTVAGTAGVGEPLEHARPQLQLQQLQYGFSKSLGELTASCQAGDVVLLAGASGCGKSCLLQTIAGEQAAIAGQLLCNQQAITALTAEQQCRQLGYLPQRPYLFGLTIAADLRLANANATDADLLAVLTLVELDTWFARQTQGLATVLGDYGVGLSGGELKRFALARLLLARPQVLLLDEPFAGLQADLAARLLVRLVSWQQQGILIMASHQQQDFTGFTQRWRLGR